MSDEIARLCRFCTDVLGGDLVMEGAPANGWMTISVGLRRGVECVQRVTYAADQTQAESLLLHAGPGKHLIEVGQATSGV